MKKILKWEPSLRFINIAAIIALVALLIPLLILSGYTAPWYDDWLYGRIAKEELEMGHGLIGVLWGAWETARVEWYAFQGTFSSGFLMGMEPLIWGEQYYFLGPVFLVLILAVSVFVLTGVLIKDILKVDRCSGLAIQAIASIMVVELIYTAQQGFYWYIGGLHYVGMHSFFMLLVAVLIRLYDAKLKSVRGVLLILASMAGALLVAGSNFVTALQGCIVMTFFTGAVCLVRKRTGIRYLPAFVVYAVGFYMNVSAPGNQVRAQSYEGWGYSPFEAVWRSFLEAFRYLWRFTDWITVAFLILLLPLIWNVVKKSSFSFKLPGLVLAGSFCLYATGFTPSLYSLGHAGLSRTLNAVKITYQILLLINEVYWLGWLKGILERRKGHISESGTAPWWYYVLVGMSMLVIFHLAPNQAGCYSSYGAYYYLDRGEAKQFYDAYKVRLELLYSDEKNIVFEPYPCRPWFLSMAELSEDPEAEENRSVAAWFGKSSIAVKAAE